MLLIFEELRHLNVFLEFLEKALQLLIRNYLRANPFLLSILLGFHQNIEVNPGLDSFFPH